METTSQHHDPINPEAQSFDQFYAVQDRSRTLKSIFREELGLSSLSAEIIPYSFVSRTDLTRIAALLQLQKEQLFADVACGNGSIGLWLARQSGAQLTGVDVAPAAVVLAETKSRKLGIASQCRFAVGSFEKIHLTNQSVDAAVSVDAIWLAADQQHALNEIARILRPGGRLVFTSWEQHIPMPFVKQPVSDYRPLLTAAGFMIESYEYLTHSEEVMKAIYARIRNAQDQLIQEMGESVRGLIGEAHFVPGLVDGINYISRTNGPHVLVSARLAE